MATNRGKEDTSPKVVGFDPAAGKRFFSRKISIKVHLCDHIVVELVHYSSLSRIIFIIVPDVPHI